MISTFTDEQSSEGTSRLTNIELEQVKQLIDNEIIIDFKYNGEVCHWRDGDMEYSILFLTEKQIDFVRLIECKMHEGMVGNTIIDDITEDVLYDKFDVSVFGFLKFEMNYDFFKYRLNNLTKDDVLDKILKYGKESLTENEKLLLGDKEMISPLDEI